MTRQQHSYVRQAALAACLTLSAAPGAPSASAAPASDWKPVDAAMGRAGVSQPGEVQRYDFPRGDLQVTVNGPGGAVRLRPALALGGWVAMHPTGRGDSAMAMGDLVLTEDEVAPVMSRLQAGGIEQSALHHHVLHESPRVLYMHVHAMGSATKLAETVRAAVALTKAPPAAAGPHQLAAGQPVTRARPSAVASGRQRLPLARPSASGLNPASASAGQAHVLPPRAARYRAPSPLAQRSTAAPTRCPCALPFTMSLR